MILKYVPHSIPVDSIKPNPFQPRKNFSEDGLHELSKSISQHGIIQPISVRQVNDTYIIIAGERRFRAAIAAGLSHIPAIVFDLDGADVAEISLVENIQRKDLNCIEEAVAIKALKSKFGLTQEEISIRLGKSRSYIANLLRLLDLPVEVINEISMGNLSMGHARALLSLPSESLILEVMAKILKSSLSVRQAESLVTSYVDEKKPKKKKTNKTPLLNPEASLYLEAISNAIKDIEKEGGKANIIEKETEDFYELIIKIPKHGI